MTRSNYSDDIDDNWQLIRWRGAVASAIKGQRGQALLREMLTALDALPHKRLIANELEAEGEVCALGAVGKCRDIDMTRLDPEDPETVAKTFDVAEALVREIAYVNDEEGPYDETPEQRFFRVERWIKRQIGP